MENDTEYNLLGLSKKTLKRKIALRVIQAETQMASMQSTSKLFKNDRKCFPSAESAEESSAEKENSTEEESSDSGTDESEDENDSSLIFSETEECDNITDLLRDLLTEFNSCAPFVNRLLPILQQAGLTYLPKTYETFMKTDAHTQ
jgi:TATA-binding protein-associated factor Taf7